jgi:hypothetical protein
VDGQNRSQIYASRGSRQQKRQIVGFEYWCLVPLPACRAINAIRGAVEAVVARVEAGEKVTGAEVKNAIHKAKPRIASSRSGEAVLRPELETDACSPPKSVTTRAFGL